jgi:hypothetical protein
MYVQHEYVNKITNLVATSTVQSSSNLTSRISLFLFFLIFRTFGEHQNRKRAHDDCTASNSPIAHFVVEDQSVG